MAEPEASCLFCGTRGTTREHVLARWIGRSLAGPPLPGITIEFKHESTDPDGNPRKPKTARTTAYFTRAFCRSCNSGWMSRLEDAAKPTLERMIHGKPWIRLSLEEQRLLAFWGAKTALAFQTQERDDTRWARDEEYRSLYEMQAPPPGWQVWVGARERFDAAWYRSHSLRLRTSDASQVDGFGVVLTVGFLVFWLIMIYDGRSHLRLVSDSAMTLKPIFPGLGRPITWPPPQRVVPVDLTHMPERWVQRSRLLAVPEGA